ncbi:PIN domain-containing protein [Candidatus Parabeggiatoa sp. HSG14]|uniref:type II toxin-antitoxin system VapC family toxin n=1 Tax=Candidatus Parabeggiatoa sp. HSG14 TaxID=3055593 RepID=UPI0025A72383|nr:PIN domain-containing protein [Thiotrichales bacterium HSG14]
METLAFVTIMQLIETGEITLVTSSILAFENHKNPFQSRQQWVNYCLNYAKQHQTVNAGIQKEAKQLENEGIKPMDALHVACAEFMGCDYFLTSDDRLIKRYKSNILQVKNPVEFIFLLTEKNHERKNVK